MKVFVAIAAFFSGMTSSAASGKECQLGAETVLEDHSIHDQVRERQGCVVHTCTPGTYFAHPPLDWLHLLEYRPVVEITSSGTGPVFYLKNEIEIQLRKGLNLRDFGFDFHRGFSWDRKIASRIKIVAVYKKSHTKKIVFESLVGVASLHPKHFIFYLNLAG